MATPPWLAATSGQPQLANQVNQFLGTHAITCVYTGAERDNQATAGSGAVGSNGLWIAQKFTAGATYASGRIVLTLALTGSPGPWALSLQADNAGAPSGTALASATLPNGFVPASAGTVSVPLSVAIASGSVYWIVAQAAGDVSDFFAWSKSNQVSGTSTSINGTSWTAQAYGLLFQAWDNTVVGPMLHTYEDSGARWTTFGRSASTAVNGLNEYTAAQNGGAFQSVRAFAYSGSDLTAVN